MRFVASVVIQPSGPGLKPLADDAGKASVALREAGDSAEAMKGKVVELEGSIDSLKEAAEGIAGLIAFEAIKEAVTKSIEVVIEGRQAYALLSATVTSTGSAAGYTADQLREMAEQQQRLTGVLAENVEQGERTLLTFTRIGHDVYPQALKATQDLAAGTGRDLSAAALLLGKALNDPLQGMTALQKAGIKLTDSQKATIASMAAVHDIAGAQAIILAEVEKRYGGDAVAAHQAKGGLDDLANAAHDLYEQFGAALLPAISSLAAELVTLSKDPDFMKQLADAGASLGSALKGVGDVVLFVLNHWELLKAGFILFIALKAPIYILEIAKALQSVVAAELAVEASNPLGWIALAITGIVLLVNHYSGLQAAEAEQAAKMADAHSAVDKLREAYGKLSSAEIDAAEAGLATLESQRIVLQNELTAILNKVTAASAEDQAEQNARRAQAGLGPAAPARADVSKLSPSDSATYIKDRDALKNLDDEFATAYDRLEKHRAALKANGEAASDWGAKAQKLKDYLSELEGALRSLIEAQDAVQGKSAQELSDADSLLAAAYNSTAAYEAEKVSISNLTKERALLAPLIKEENEAVDKGEDAIAGLTKEYGANSAQVQIAVNLVGEFIDRTDDSIEKVTAQAQAIEVAGLKLAAWLKFVKDLGAENQKWADGMTSAFHDVFDTEHQFNVQLDTTKASFIDWQAQTAAVDQYGEGIAGILKQYGLLDQATEKVAIAEEIYQKTKGKTTDQAAQITQDILNFHAALDKIHADFASAAIEKWVAQPFEDAFTSIESSFTDTLNTMIVTGKADWSSFFQGFLTAALQAIEQWLVRWLQAIAIRNAADSASSGTSLSGGGVNLGGLSSLFGGGAAAAPAAGEAATSAQWASYTGADAYAASGASAGSSAGISGGAQSVVALAVAVAIAHYLISHATPRATDIVDAVNGRLQSEGASNTFGDSTAQAVAEAMGATVAANVNNFLDQLDARIDSTTKLEIGRYGRGPSAVHYVYYTDQYGQTLRAYFKNIADAIDFATVEAIRESNLAGVSPEIKTAIKNSPATTTDQFNQDVQTGTDALHDRLGAQGSQLYDLVKKYDDEINAEKALGLSIDATVAARDRDVQAMKNQLLGINTGTADYLASLRSFNDGIDEVASNARDLVTSQIADVQRQIDAMGSGPGDSPGITGANGQTRPETQQEWDAEMAHLKQEVSDYLAELDKIPQKLSETELNMAVFDSLYQYLQGSHKYAAQEVEYAKMKVDLEFQAIKVQIIALGLWEKYAQMWTDAYNNALHDASKPPSAAGGGGGNNRAQAATDWKTTLQGIMDANTPLIAQFHQLQQSEQDLRDKAKAAHASAAELAAGLAALDAQFKKNVRDQANQLAGIGTDFTRSLQSGLDFFNQLETLGRAKTGIPDWLEKIMKGEFLDQMKAQWKSGVEQLAGISDPFASIDSQADQLRQNLVALAAATGMTAQQVQDGMDQIAGAEAMAKRSALNGILDTIFGYLKDDPKYAAQSLALKKDEVDLQFQILKAQLIAAKAWDTVYDPMNAGQVDVQGYSGVWQDAYNAAMAAAGAASDVNGAASNLASAADDLATAQANAASKFTDLVKSLVDSNRQVLTGSASSLSAPEKYQTALGDYQQALAAAQNGDSTAMGNLPGLRDTLLQVAQQYFAGGAGQGLSGGYDQLLRSTVQDFATLALSPTVQTKTIADLVAQDANSAATQHEDLVAIRQTMIDLLASNHVGNVIGGAVAFAPVPSAVPTPSYSMAPIVYVPTPANSNSSGDSGQTAAIQVLSGKVDRIASALAAMAPGVKLDLDSIANSLQEGNRMEARKRVKK